MLDAYDLIENGGSVGTIERTLAELRRFDPENEVLPELEWKLVDVLVSELHTEPGTAGAQATERGSVAGQSC